MFGSGITHGELEKRRRVSAGRCSVQGLEGRKRVRLCRVSTVGVEDKKKKRDPPLYFFKIR